MRLERRPHRALRLQRALRAPRRWEVRRVQTCLDSGLAAAEACPCDARPAGRVDAWGAVTLSRAWPRHSR